MNRAGVWKLELRLVDYYVDVLVSFEIFLGTHMPCEGLSLVTTTLAS